MASRLSLRCAAAALGLVLCGTGAHAGERPLDSEPSPSPQRPNWYVAF